MKNGYDEKLAEKFSGFGINQYDRSGPSFNNNDSLYQVLKAVETAETTIQQQEEENNWLRSELQRKTQELKKYNHDESVDQRSHHVAPWNELGHGSYESCQSVPSQARNNEENQALNSKINGTLRAHPNDHLTTDDTGPSQLSSPSTRSISPTRHVIEGDYESRPSSSGQRLLPMAEMNNSSSQWKQVQEHEEEIMKLRKHLADYSIREAQICNEKYVLEKRIAYMRLAFDQQQQDLVDAASKALSYRQDIIEENIRLTYALQDAQQERSTFIQSLLPLLAEYSLQPPLPDAQSIVSNVKVLFKHLQEKLIRIESKLKESQYQLVPWNSDMNHANFASQSSSHSVGAQLSPVYVSGQTGTEWDVLGGQQSGLGGGVVNNANPDGLRTFSPLESSFGESLKPGPR